MEPTIIRASSTPLLLDCTRMWAGRNLADELHAATGIRPRYLPIAVGAPIGTGVHALGAHLLTAKKRGATATFKDAQERGMEALDDALREGEVLWDGTAANRADAQKQVTRMGLVYADQVVPFVEPKLVEERLFATFAPGFLISGQMDDLVLYNSKHRIRDTKTGSTPGGVAAQLGTYSLLGQSHGWPVEGLDVDFIKRMPLNKPQPDVKMHSLDQDACEAASFEACTIAVESVTTFRRTGEMRAFRPNPSSKLCSATWCPLHSTPLCRAHFPDDEED